MKLWPEFSKAQLDTSLKQRAACVWLHGWRVNYTNTVDMSETYAKELLSSPFILP